MNSRTILLIAVVAAWACNGAPGRPGADSAVIPPNRVLDFDVLYASNCAGCHGANGAGGLASSLADPLYVAIADDETIRRLTASGVPGTAMPAFAQSAGGLLTDEQIDAIVKGIRARWSQPNTFGDATVPPYAAAAPGNPAHGADVYAEYCASCHGTGGHGGPRASSIVDGSYLLLVSDQSLRTSVIVGRPEMGAPDWRSNVPGKPLSAEQITDVVAWLAAQRPRPSLPGPRTENGARSTTVGGLQ